MKGGHAAEEPELFATYVALSAEACEVVRAHVVTLTDLLGITAYGVSNGEFRSVDPVATGRAVFQATSQFDNR